MVSKWVFHPLSPSPCHNHCSLWSLCPLCPFKMQHVMRALEDCVSGLFSYSDKSSSHFPRSLTRLCTDTSQLSSLIVCPVHKVTNYTELLQTLKSMCFNCWLRSCRSFASMHPHVGLITPKTSKFLHKELQSSDWACGFLLLSDAVFFTICTPWKIHFHLEFLLFHSWW